MHRANELEGDLLQFSVKVIKYVTKYSEKIPKPLQTQLIKSATSVGANYTEAINTSSKADFKNKIFIAKKEASETKYWLKILVELSISIDEAAELIDEIQRFIIIFQKTVNTINGKR